MIRVFLVLSVIMGNMSPLAIGETKPLLDFATYLGGSLRVDDGASAIAVDMKGCVFVAGVAMSADFPVTEGAWDTSLDGESDMFLVKLSPLGDRLMVGTFLGGSDSEGMPGLAIDVDGNAILVSGTHSPDYPVTPGTVGFSPHGGEDICISIVSPDGGTLLHSTRIGGAANDNASRVVLDRRGQIVVAGVSFSRDFPVTADALQSTGRGNSDSVICRLNPSLTEIQYATLLGGDRQDVCMGLGVDDRNHVTIAGFTNSSDYPTTPGALARGYLGPSNPPAWTGDAFVARLAFDVVVADGPIHNISLDRRYRRIQHAILDAESGDCIHIAPGLYREALELTGKDLSLRSEDPNNPIVVGATVINGRPNAPVLALGDNSKACEIAGLTLRAGRVGVLGSVTNATFRPGR